MLKALLQAGILPDQTIVRHLLYKDFKLILTTPARGPCPMLNSLANHKFLPHDGRNFTLDKVTDALKTALNISEEIGSLLNDFALTTNPNATTWGLDTLSKHNILEHDASLRYVSPESRMHGQPDDPKAH
jgi:hypothetical protein